LYLPEARLVPLLLLLLLLLLLPVALLIYTLHPKHANHWR
jgi:hypothetical protein